MPGQTGLAGGPVGAPGFLGDAGSPATANSECAVDRAIDLAGPGGRHVRVCWGEEIYSPVSYNSFHVGPFEEDVHVPEGESVTLAVDRAQARMARHAQKQFDLEAPQYMANLARLTVLAREPR